MHTLADKICRFVEAEVEEAGRPDLFRSPLCAFSSAEDPRYQALKTVIGPWHALPTELLPGARSVISYFVPFTRQVVEHTKRADPTAEVWSDAYIALNRLFRAIGDGLAALLEAQGFLALNIAATHNFDAETLHSPWSHRSAAAISGMGSFGVNRMLITQRGSAGRFCTVITSAPLSPSPSPAPVRCRYHADGGCLACVKSCPTGALTAEGLDGPTCYTRCLENAARFEKPDGDVCGKCLVVCPVAYLE